MSMITRYSGGSWQESYYRKYHAGLTSVGLPVYLAVSGNTLDNSDVEIAGNIMQTGTPTPYTPIMPDFVGKSTANLYNNADTDWEIGILDDNGNHTGSTTSHYTKNFTAVEPKTAYYLSGTIYIGQSGHRIYYYDANKNWISRSPLLGYDDCNFTTPANCKYVRIQMSVDLESTSDWMLNLGSTALPYEPYGYKIPFTCAGQTTPVYLGQTQTVRQIKKLVLTGEEDWTLRSAGTGIFYIAITNYLKIKNVVMCICSHYSAQASVNGWTDVPNKKVAFYAGGEATKLLYIRDTDFVSADSFKQFLSDQYAAGTPVIIWYVLATPETTIVNEPLCKIGDYADELHLSDAGVTIPVPAGDTKLDIDTYLPPSSVKISNFWSTHSDVKIYQNNAWQISSWDGFRDLVRAGTAETAYPVGTILYTTWGDTTSEAVQILAYDVTDYMNPMLTGMGYTHNVVLCDLKADSRRLFDNAEAWLYVETEVPAGVYRFTIPNYDSTYGGNKTYIFTSTATIPVGGQITLSWAYQQNPTSVAGYSSPDSSTALFTASISVWDGTTASTDLGTIKLTMTDPESNYGKLNHIQRARYGSNNYYQSGIRQWLNSDKPANTWWAPTTIFDRSYSNRNTNGKLYSLSRDFVRSLAKSTVKCVTNQVFELGSIGNTLFSIPDKPYIVRDRVFMLTHTEVNLSSAPNVGGVLTFYSGAGNSARIKYNNNGGAEHWWLRTPNPTGVHNERYVYSSGALYYSYATTASIVGVAAYTIQ